MASTHGIAVAAALAAFACHRANAATVSASGPGGTTLTLSGRIGPHDDGALASALRRAEATGRRIRSITLESPGGDAAGALRLAMRILAARLGTRVDANGTCASACFIVFAAGRPRSVGPGALLGVHRVAVDGRDTPRGRQIDDRLAAVLRDLGTPGSVVAAMLATPPDSLHVLDAAELAEMGVEVAE